MNPPGFLFTSLKLSSGVIVWALHFALIYGLTALACARGWLSAIPWIVGTSSVAAGLAMAVILIVTWRRRDEFLGWITMAIAALSLVAIVWEALPILLLPACV